VTPEECPHPGTIVRSLFAEIYVAFEELFADVNTFGQLLTPSQVVEKWLFVIQAFLR
jgi:hypothetical protein